MAIWQFKTQLIPEQRVREHYGRIPVTIPVDDTDNVQWWDGIPLPKGFEAEITAMLPVTESWSSSSHMWGDHKNDTDFAWVMYTDESLTTVEAIEFRFHAAEISSAYVTQACEFAARHGCLFVDNRSRRVMMPTVASLMDGLKKSAARKFVDDPVTTLTNLPPIVVPDDLTQEPSRFRRLLSWFVGMVRANGR
jgi:hypothetical protein